jgi:hypothetical protein
LASQQKTARSLSCNWDSRMLRRAILFYENVERCHSFATDATL